MKKHIDFGIIETWPDNLKRLVFDFSEEISSEKKADWENILAGKAHYNIIPMPTFDRVKSEIEELLIGSSALAWHCTKLVNPERIRSEGLRPFSVKLIKELIKFDLSHIFSVKEQDLILKKIDKHNRSGLFDGRSNQLWFLLNREMWSDIGCREFFDFFGGEALRKVIESELPEYLPFLKKVGEPYLLEFPVKLKHIASYQISHLTDELINFGINTMTGELEPYIFAEGRVYEKIPSAKFIKLSSFNEI
ncbi:hypothetical protein [Algoriphagus formosus]|uniref:hypothetical protein n=1 Tax=Algoriphagus formosus TaxID=2007308 RepID=UPI000C290B9C|nr:hypothetical protein [Algoriphagus formosus]